MQIKITKDVVTKLLDVVDAGLVTGMGEPIPGQMCVEAAVCYALGLPHSDDPQCVAPSLRSLKIRLNDSAWSSIASRAKGLRRLAVIQLGSKDHLDAKEFATRCAELATKTCVPSALRAAASIHKDPKHVHALRDAANRCEIEGSRESAEDARGIASGARRDAAAYAVADAAADAAAAAAAAAAAYAAAAADAAAVAAAAAAADAAADAAAAAVAAAAAAAYAAAYAGAAAVAAAAAYARDKSLAAFAEGVVQILIEMNVPGVQWLELTEIAA
jgi:hypothetical protein